jgi:U4/U6.U5 tri-snRNP-associated protein 1
MDAASIEQMNKVRASLGMAPLPVPGAAAGGPEFKQKDDDSESEEEDNISTLDKRQAAAGNNWQRLEAERQEKVDREKRKEAAKKARDTIQRHAKLEGKGLGDADEGEELDTRAWLMQQKKRQKKIEKARKMEAELAEREREMQAEYTAKDLAGVRVAHEADQFDEMTGEQILTLKDAEIGADSEDDELENQELNAKDKLEEKLRLLKKRPDYDPTEQEEVKGVLSKYDEEIDGKQAKRFTLDGKGSTVEGKRKALEANSEARSKGIKINLDILQDDTPVSDYVDPSTVKVKKPKKKKEKKTRQKAADEDDIIPILEPTPAVQSDANAMDVDGAQNNSTSVSKKRVYDFEDDEDLQAKLAESRRQALKKRKKMDGAELARQMREQMPVDEDEQEEGGMTIDETTEFVANLKKPDEREDDSDRERRARQRSSGPAAADEDEDGDATMAGQSYGEVADAEDREVSTPAAEVTTTGLDEEDDMAGQGMAASLNLLRKRGLVADGAGGEIAEKDRRRNKFLAEKQNLIDEFDQRARDQRESERNSGRWEKMSHKDRDDYARRQNEQREQYLSKLQAEMFNRDYRPDVKLQYHDEFGRSMNQKEAFKHLSHMFHGKGSGKQKTEKRLKKIDDEKKNMAKGVLNVGDEGGMMNVQGREGKRQKTAGVRLQ